MIKLKDLLNEAITPKGWNMTKKFIKILEREIKNLKKYHNQQNDDDFLEVVDYMQLQLDMLKKNIRESINEGFTKYHIRLTDTPGWYGVWDKKGKQKFEGDKRFVMKQLKKLKTRMGNYQLKSLIDVATKRKGKDITFDVVESITEDWSKGSERYKVTLENGKEIDVKVKKGEGLEGVGKLLDKEGLKYEKVIKKASRPTLTNEARKYKLGDQWSKDFDYVGMLKWGIRADLRMSEQELLALFKSYEDVNYHKASAPLWDALVALKKDEKSKAKSLLKKFNNLSKKEL